MDILFKNRNEIFELINRVDDSTETKNLILYFQEQKKKRHEFYLTLEELNRILKWKLGKQFERQREIRKNNTESNVKIITKAAFAVTETELKLKILSTLAGVEIPVASAILTLCYPEQFAVIDFRNWRQINKSVERKTYYTVKEYLKYLHTIREYSQKYNVTPQEIDLAIWQKDIEQEKSK